MPKIALSDCGRKNENYRSFVSRIPGSEIVILPTTGNHNTELERCDALVLTGGKDVAPELYGDWPDETVEVDPQRDGAEFRMLETALKLGIPVLGICRGLQVVNVFLGGTLIIDLEKYYHRQHREVSDNVDRLHNVSLSPGSRLREFIGVDSGEVNSAHHQAPDRIGRGLKVAARAEDGTVEALEGNEENTRKIVLVQWHPERMDFSSHFANGVMNIFKYNLDNNQNSEKYSQWRSNNG